jgi:hypothetical protein
MSAAQTASKFSTFRPAGPRGDKPAPCPTSAARRLVAMLILLMVGCGGSESQPAPELALGSDPAPRSAVVFPARVGLALIDESADGVTLQQSGPTNDAGAASFASAVAGSRLAASEVAAGWRRLPVNRSARLRGDGETLELTPLTTAFDHIVAAGMPEAWAQTRLFELLAGACAVTPQVLPIVAMYGDHPLTGSVRDWLLPALDAYLDAIARLGMSPQTPGVDWPGLLDKHAVLLAQLCDAARTTYSDTWSGEAEKMLASRSGLTADAAKRALLALRPQALKLVLDRLADQIAAREHPLLGVTLQAETPEWVGDPPGQVAGLIDAAVARLTPGAATSADMTSMALDRQGQIVQTISAQTPTWADTDSPPVRFINHAAETRSVTLRINGAALDSMADLMFEVLALPAERADEPLQRRAWRYLVKSSAHAWPITGGSFQHQAELFLRSVGRGLCDDVAQALSFTWQAMGYETRVMGLSGHVVPEVLVDGRWELYDPDYRVHYLNQHGQVASVADLAGDATLITEPQQRSTDALAEAYDATLAAIYASTHDNVVEDWLAQVQAPFGPTLDVPAGATVEVRGAGAISVPTTEPGIAVEAASLQLRLPAGYTGTLQLPYVLTDVTGDGRVVWLWQTAEVTPEGLAHAINDRYRGTPGVGVTQIEIERVGPGGLMLTMMVNPSLAPRGAMLQATLTGPTVAGIEVITANR